MRTPIVSYARCRTCLFVAMLIVSTGISSLRLANAQDFDGVKSDAGHIETKAIAGETSSDPLTVQHDTGNNFLFDDSTHYQIKWAGPWPKDLVKDENSLFVRTEGGKYMCNLPQIARKTDRMNDGGEFEQTISAAYELLRPIFTHVCSYRLEPYWTYELCHGRYVRQYHDEKSKQEFILGRFDATTLAAAAKEFTDKVRSSGSWPSVTVEETRLPYVELNMTGGTVCDLSQKPRLTRVLYVCGVDAKHELYSLKETSTCEYEAIVLSPLMCELEEFKVNGARENDINCYALDESPTKPPSLNAVESREPESLEKLLGKNILFSATDKDGRGVDIQFKVIELPDHKDLRGISGVGSPSGLQSPQDPMPVLAHQSVSDEEMVKDFLSGKLCFTGSAGYWKYELCYGKQVQQFHEEKGVRGATILLGRWSLEQHKMWLETNTNRHLPVEKTPKHVSHMYGEGDMCDVSGKPRRVEVKFKCKYNPQKPSAVSLYLVEPRTCDYVLVVEGSFICHLLNRVDGDGLFTLNR